MWKLCVVISAMIILFLQSSVDNLDAASNSTANFKTLTNSSSNNLSQLLNLIQNSQRTDNIPLIKLVSEIDQNFFLTTLLTSILAGLLTGLGIIFGDRILHLITRPRISLNKPNIMLRKFQISAYTIKDTNIPFQFRSFPVWYVANRVIVLNQGSTAAEESKGAMRIKRGSEEGFEEELKLSWTPTIERYKMIINAHSEEYLDVCAVCDEDRTDVLDRLRRQLDSCEEYMRQEISNLAIKTPLLIQLNDIRNAYASPTAISEIIAPTENGWHILNHNRELRPSDNDLKYRLIVTSKNSNKINEIFELLSPQDSTKKVIKFPEK
jgi:hypothetical protein